MIDEPKSGWMVERGPRSRVYHYIENGMSLCRRLGFYSAELIVDDGTSPKGVEDCASCFRILRRREVNDGTSKC